MELYIERWLKAPAQDEEGRLLKRERGTPQGGVISPTAGQSVSALRVRSVDGAKFLICRSSGTRTISSSIAGQRGKRTWCGQNSGTVEECGLELHPEKTKVVYCKDTNRRGTYPNEKFDFLGYTFRPRKSKNRKGKRFVSFSPAISDNAAKTIRDEIRSGDCKRSDKSIEDLSRMFNPILRGWLQYYGRYYRSALYGPCATGPIVGSLGVSEI